MFSWIEKTEDYNYTLICPKCGFSYKPHSNEDGTINSTEIYKFCPKCGEALKDPSENTRW